MNTKQITENLKRADNQMPLTKSNFQKNQVYTYLEPGLDQEIEVVYMGKYEFMGIAESGVYHMFTDTETPIQPLAFLLKENEALNYIK